MRRHTCRVAFTEPAETAETQNERFDATYFERQLRQTMADRAAQQQLREAAEAALVRCGGWGIDMSRGRSNVMPINRIPLPRSDMGVVVLDDVFPADWCACFIRAHEAVGFIPQHELDKLTAFGSAKQVALAQASEEMADDARYYLQGKNSSEVVTITSQELADELWERVRPYVPGETADKSRPLSGRFKAVGIIPEFRFMRYSAGQAFRVHKDPPRLAEQNPRTGARGFFKSLVTLAIYLNDQSEFEGGALNFVELKVSPKRYESVATVAPAVGRCAIFRHHELHEGGELASGSKHMVQCDVLYEWMGAPSGSECDDGP